MLKSKTTKSKTSKQKNLKDKDKDKAKAKAKIATNKQAKAKTSQVEEKALPETKEIIIGGKKAQLTKVGSLHVLRIERPKIDQAREDRIVNEYLVDCYDEAEKAMSWYYSVEDKLQFPFTAKCIKEREISPLQIGEQVEVIEMASEKECHSELFVKIKWEKRSLAVPLYQLQGIKVDKETEEAIEDWHYWKDMGYEY